MATVSRNTWLMIHVLVFVCTDDQFVYLQRGFLEENYSKFEDVEENKLEYMDVFKRYVRESTNLKNIVLVFLF